MSRRDIDLLLLDMRESAEKILKYTSGFDFQELLKDDKTIDVVVRGHCSNRGRFRDWEQNLTTRKTHPKFLSGGSSTKNILLKIVCFVIFGNLLLCVSGYLHICPIRLRLRSASG